MMLEEALIREDAANRGTKKLPPPVKGPFPLTGEFLDWAKRERRD